MDDLSSTSAASPPLLIGPFRVVQLLGSGGMGAVYLAERTEPFKQQAAIKLLHLHTSASLLGTRANDEARIIAFLDHENIVRLLDEGETDSKQKYFVMDYVDGLPIDEFCRLGRIGLAERMRILLGVINAVAYAHRHLVVHADLKPTNILVNANGQPKLVDFGIAALLWETRGPKQTLGYTPLFASPEQSAGKTLTVASDIYTLGVLGGMLLAGVEPAAEMQTAGGFGRAMRRAMRAEDGLQERATERALTAGELKRAAAGDLGAILIKATERQPDRRYGSADALAEDLRRYMEGRPVTARPGTQVDRTWKWARRNPLLAVMSGLLLMTISVSAIGVAVQTARATRQRRVAQRRLQDLVQLTGVLDGELYQSLGGLGQADGARRTLLVEARRTLQELGDGGTGKGVGVALAGPVDPVDPIDPQLALEMARQYEQLGRLELAEGPLHEELRSQGMADAERATRLLDGLPRRMRAEPAVRERYASLRAMRGDASLR